MVFFCFVLEYILRIYGVVIINIRINDIKFKNVVVICLWDFFFWKGKRGIVILNVEF